MSTEDRRLEDTSISKSHPADDAIAYVLGGSGKARYGRFVIAALGSIPWVGGILAASSALHAEIEQGRINELIQQWLDEHREKIASLADTIQAIADRLVPRLGNGVS